MALPVAAGHSGCRARLLLNGRAREPPWWDGASPALMPRVTSSLPIPTVMSPSVKTAMPRSPVAAPAVRILLADADPLRSRTVVSGLRALGWAPIAALDALQALTFAIRQQPHAIVLHVRLPGGNGIGALRRIRSTATTAKLPVLVVGVPEDGDVVRGFLEAGADALLTSEASAESIAMHVAALLPEGMQAQLMTPTEMRAVA